MKKEVLIAIITGTFILGGAILSSPHWFKHFFPEQYLEQEKIKPTQLSSKYLNSASNKDDAASIDKNTKSGTENIVISRIELSPKDFQIPSYFYFQVSNNGTRTIKNLEITVDLGKSIYEEFDFSRKVEIHSIIDSLDRSFLKFNIPNFKQYETIDCYSLLTLPIFESITMNASNMTFDKIYSYEEFEKSEENIFNTSSGFRTFLTVMLSLVIIVFTVYFVIIIITYLNKVFKIE
jgi:hypothetical protein